MTRAGAALLGTLALLVACDDMTEQPRRHAYSWAGPASPPDGIVAFDDVPVLAPPVTLALLKRGQERYRVYCTPCHSELGDGRGMVVQRGFPAPPSYHTDRLRQAPVQHFYDVITDGHGAMYPFAARVQPADRWAIAAYIRALQRSQDARVADLTVRQRDALQ